MTKKKRRKNLMYTNKFYWLFVNAYLLFLWLENIRYRNTFSLQTSHQQFNTHFFLYLYFYYIIIPIIFTFVSLVSFYLSRYPTFINLFFIKQNVPLIKIILLRIFLIFLRIIKMYLVYDKSLRCIL